MFLEYEQNMWKLGKAQVLIAIGCLRLARAARAWEDASYGGRLTDGAQLQLEVGPGSQHVPHGLTKIQGL